MQKTLTGKIDKFLDGAIGPRTVKGRAGKDQTDLEGDQLPPYGCIPQSGDVPFLDSHNPTKVLGRAAYRVSGDELLVTVTFAPEGIDPNIDAKCALAKNGTITGLSVGVTPLESQPIKGTKGRRITSWKIHEISLVAIPALESAHITHRSHGTGLDMAALRAKAAALQERVRREDAAAAERDADEEQRQAWADAFCKLPRSARVAYARELAARGQPKASSPRVPGLFAGYHEHIQRSVAHCNAVHQLQRETSPSRNNRLVKAEQFAKKIRPAGY